MLRKRRQLQSEVKPQPSPRQNVEIVKAVIETSKTTLANLDKMLEQPMERGYCGICRGPCKY